MKKTRVAEVRDYIRDLADDVVVWFGQNKEVNETELAELLADHLVDQQGGYDENTEDQIGRNLDVFVEIVQEELAKRKQD